MDFGCAVRAALGTSFTGAALAEAYSESQLAPAFASDCRCAGLIGTASCKVVS